MTEYERILRYGFAALLITSAFGIDGAIASASAQNVGRDPFKKYEAPHAVVRRHGSEISVPSIQERIAQYKAQKLAAMTARMPVAKPTTALLLNEMRVIGISRSPRGYAAIVEAVPIKLTYVIYPGERFYDGQLVAIEDFRLVFRRTTVLSDGERKFSVEVKPLLQANAADAMRAAPSATLAMPEKEKAPVTSKP